MPAPEPSGVVDPQLVTTTFVTSWLGRARPGDRHDPDPARRAAAWAQWAVHALTPMSGTAARPYTALVLPGQFYDPNGRMSASGAVRPHLEVPGHLMDRNDPTFPDRLSQAGNGLEFPWWLVPEVLAVKRAMFSVPRVAPTDLCDTVAERRVPLVAALEEATARANRRWAELEELLIAEPEAMATLATSDFTAEDVAAYFPPAADLNTRVEFDRILREKSGVRAARRVGVWRVVTGDPGSEAVLGVITPRLTRSSLFTDPLFRPTVDSPAACLVRGLLLRRVLHGVASIDTSTVADLPAAVRPGSLRAVPARVGEKLPEASVAAAVKFLRTYPDSEAAWDALAAWAGGRGTSSEPRNAVLTVARSDYVTAHKAAARAVRRAEDPSREDINVVLPLAWDANRVVRVTFSSSDD